MLVSSVFSTLDVFPHCTNVIDNDAVLRCLSYHISWIEVSHMLCGGIFLASRYHTCGADLSNVDALRYMYYMVLYTYETLFH